MPKTRRVELLFEPEQYERLEEIARVRKESVGSLIREAVVREYLVPEQEKKQAALERLLSQQIDFGPWEQVKKEIGEEIIRELETP